MTVVVDIRHVLGAKDPVFKAFITAIIRQVTVKNPDHHFVFITDKGLHNPLFTGGNIEQVAADRSAAHRLFRKYWLNVRLPALLKKKGAAMLITTDGSCSLGAGLPQYMLVSGMELLQQQGGDKVKCLQKADRIIVFSEKIREDIISKYRIPAAKTAMVKAAASAAFRPLSFEEKQAIKDKYTAGKEYFVYTGLISRESNLLNLLKAFSIFKKRQQSGIRLLLVGEMDQKDKAFSLNLAAYKYREEVVLTGPLTSLEKAGLVAAAYALIDPSLQEGMGIPAMEAAACDVPVIAVAGQPLLEKEAFLEADTGDPADIAAKMMLLYKDETLRYRLIEKARAAVKRYSQDQSAEQLWELILQGVR